jgi:hypothetical protein
MISTIDCRPRHRRTASAFHSLSLVLLVLVAILVQLACLHLPHRGTVQVPICQVQGPVTCLTDVPWSQLLNVEGGGSEIQRSPTIASGPIKLTHSWKFDLTLSTSMTGSSEVMVIAHHDRLPKHGEARSPVSPGMMGTKSLGS